MLRSNFGWSCAAVVALVCIACGESKGDDTNDDVPKAGKGGSTMGGSAGIAGKGGSAGKSGSGTGGSSGKGGSGKGGSGDGGSVSAGKGGTGGSDGGDSGKGGSGGSSAGKSAGGTGQGGSAGQAGAGKGGTGGLNGDAGAPDDGTIQGMLTDLHDAVATACSTAATCCDAMAIPTMLDDCESMYDSRQAGVAGIEAGFTTIDADALARCKAAYMGADQCNLNRIVAACDGVFVGHQGVGEPCIGGYDCDPSVGTMTCLITDTSGDNNMGTCQKVPHAKLNEPCFYTCRAGEDCGATSTQGIATPEELALCFEDEGLYCDSNETTPVCKTLLELGAECGDASWDACGSHAQCNTTCEKVGDLGDDCGSCFHSYQCIEGKCTDPLWATESTCMGYPPGP